MTAVTTYRSRLAVMRDAASLKPETRAALSRIVFAPGRDSRPIPAGVAGEVEPRRTLHRTKHERTDRGQA